VEFSAAAVAAGLGQGVVQVDDACASLARRGQLLQAVGERIWPDGTVAGGYRFAHALYQDVLYGRVSAARRVQLHQRIGARLEGGYGAQAGPLAAELAVHFERGQDYPRAVQYRRQAAQNALRRSAYREAIDHLTKGLTLLPRLPDTSARARQELHLQITLAKALMLTKGYGVPEAEHALLRAQELCHRGEDVAVLFSVQQGLHTVAQARAELRTACTLAKDLLRIAQRQQEPALSSRAYSVAGEDLL
jgi:predicted ATPase